MFRLPLSDFAPFLLLTVTVVLALSLVSGPVRAAEDEPLSAAATRNPNQVISDESGQRFLVLTAGPRELHVCSSEDSACDFRTIANAVKAAETGDIIRIAPGVYEEAAVLRAHSVTILAERGAHMRNVAAENKAALVIKGDNITIKGLECSGIRVPDRNGACIRLEGKNLTLQDVYFHDSESGILGGGGRLLIEDSRFERLGADTGQSHGLYVWGDEVIIRNSWFLSGKQQGHEIKSGAARTVIEESLLASLDGQDSRLLDAMKGGEVIIRNSILEMGPKSANHEMIGVGYEGISHKVNSALIEGNTIIIDRPGGVLYGGPVSAQIRNNVIIGGEQIDKNEWFPDRESAGIPPYPLLPLE